MSTSERSATATHVPLGWFRFLLAAMVFLNHTDGVVLLLPGTVTPGAIAVFMFFILSGYLITSGILTFYPKAPLRFAANRFLKIYPAFWLAYGFSLAILMLDGGQELMAGPAAAIARDGLTTRRLLMALSVVGGYVDGIGLHPLSPAWTLGIEVFFYLVIAAAVHVGGPLLGKGPALAAAGVAALALYLLSVLVPGNEVRFFSFMRYAPLFCLGGALSVWRSGRHPFAAAMMIAAGAASLHWLLGSRSYRYVGFEDSRQIVDTAVMIGLFLIFILCIRLRIAGWHAALDRRLGDLTYPLYLIHVPVIVLLWRGGGSFGVLPLLATFGACLAAAWVLWLVAEYPFEVLKTRLRGART